MVKCYGELPSVGGEILWPAKRLAPSLLVYYFASIGCGGLVLQAAFTFKRCCVEDSARFLCDGSAGLAQGVLTGCCVIKRFSDGVG